MEGKTEENTAAMRVPTLREKRKPLKPSPATQASSKCKAQAHQSEGDNRQKKTSATLTVERGGKVNNGTHKVKQNKTKLPQVE